MFIDCSHSEIMSDVGRNVLLAFWSPGIKWWGKKETKYKCASWEGFLKYLMFFFLVFFSQGSFFFFFFFVSQGTTMPRRAPNVDPVLPMGLSWSPLVRSRNKLHVVNSFFFFFVFIKFVCLGLPWISYPVARSVCDPYLTPKPEAGRRSWLPGEDVRDPLLRPGWRSSAFLRCVLGLMACVLDLLKL